MNHFPIDLVLVLLVNVLVLDLVLLFLLLLPLLLFALVLLEQAHAQTSLDRKNLKNKSPSRVKKSPSLAKKSPTKNLQSASRYSFVNLRKFKRVFPLKKRGLKIDFKLM